jgi:hypothetical protein
MFVSETNGAPIISEALPLFLGINRYSPLNILLCIMPTTNNTITATTAIINSSIDPLIDTQKKIPILIYHSIFNWYCVHLRLVPVFFDPDLFYFFDDDLFADPDLLALGDLDDFLFFVTAFATYLPGDFAPIFCDVACIFPCDFERDLDFLSSS